MTGEQLWQLRARWQLTQEEFADYCGVRAATVSRWETGKRRIPKMLVQLLAHRLKKGARERLHRAHAVEALKVENVALRRERDRLRKIVDQHHHEE